MFRWAALLWFALLASGAEAQVKRPLVFIPGILGSRLCIAQDHGTAGDMIWGDLGSLRDLALLEFGTGKSERNLRPCGLVEAIVTLGPLWQADVYTPLISHLRKIGYGDDRLFIFAYDWRQSNVESAVDLARFVESEAGLRQGEFDILAHSMGGLVARHFISRHPEPAARVKRILTMGTPFQGAARVLEVLSGGWGAAANMLIPGRIQTVRRTALSFPSIFELLPNYQFGRSCCRFGRIGAPGSADINIYDPLQWDRNGWLPLEYRDGPRRTTFERNLANARQVWDGLAKPLASSPPEVRYIGTRRDTPLYMFVDPARPSLDEWEFSRGAGDSVVPAWSAADATDGTLAGARPTFATHATIFNDEGLKESLKLELAELPAPRSGAATVALTTSGTVPLNRLDLHADQFYNRHGEKVRVKAVLQFGSSIGGAGIVLSATQSDGSERIPLRDISTADERAADTLRFEGELPIAGPPGPKRIDVDIPGAGTQSVYVEVVP